MADELCTFAVFYTPISPSRKGNILSKLCCSPSEEKSETDSLRKIKK